MAKLMQVTIDEVQTNRLAIAKECARQYNAIAVLKGANTVVASPEGGTVYVNPTGNPGLAKGGSGDMLAGMIASLVAQGMDCYSASRAGVYLHGLCGDEASKKHSVRALTPSLCIREMPKVFKRMETYTPAVYYNIK
jgi:NAD(P)H-hydrate epimerase